MKKVLWLLVFICFFSCSKTKQEILKNEIETKIKSGLNDPSSYEFERFRVDSSMIEIQRELEKMRLKKNDTTYCKKSIIKYDGSFSFRSKNSYGALILANYYYQADKNYKLLYLMDNLNDTIYTDVDIMTSEVNEMMKK